MDTKSGVTAIAVVIIIVLMYGRNPYVAAGFCIVLAAAYLYFHLRRRSATGGAPPQKRIVLSDESAARAFNLAQQGHRTESLVRYILNKHTTRGRFYEVRGEDPGLRLPWLYVTDSSAPGGKVYLDLDCYNEDLGVAFEYDGPHHTEPPRSADNRIMKKWLVQRYNDREKTRLCQENRTRLVRVDYRAAGALEEYIKSRMRDLGIYSGPVQYIPQLPPLPVKYADYINSIRVVRRFGDDGPTLEPKPW